MVYLSITISYPSTQFEELYGPFVNLRAHLPLKGNSPNNITKVIFGYTFHFYFFKIKNSIQNIKTFSKNLPCILKTPFQYFKILRN